jgi:proteasome accessory factor B
MVKNSEKWQPTKSDKSERLMQLTCALLFSERGLNKKELFAAIPSYKDAISSGNSEESLFRMFERDKTDLRNTGIQVEIKENPIDGDDVRYVIASDTFVWPKQVQLTPHQLQLLNLAAGVWAHASLQADANRALIRLKALGVAPAAADLIGYAPRIKTHEPAFMPLNLAIDGCYEVQFSYRKPDGQVELRHVQPWALRNIDGQWLVISFDKQRNAVRNFLLKRIVSKVQPVKIDESDVTFETPNAADVNAAVADLELLAENQVAEIRVKPDSQAWFHFQLDEQPKSHDGTVSVHFYDLHLFAEQLREFAMDVTVIRPAALKDAIRSGFEKVVNAHA